MAVELSVTLEGEQQLSRKLLIIADGLNDFSEPLRSIEGELAKSFQENFDARGGLFQTGGWAPRKDKNPWPILERTGAMRQNFKSEMQPTFVRFYNPTSYFKYHQSNQPRTKLPRRVMMKIDQQRKTFVVKAFQAYIVALTRKG